MLYENISSPHNFKARLYIATRLEPVTICKLLNDATRRSMNIGLSRVGRVGSLCRLVTTAASRRSAVDCCSHAMPASNWVQLMLYRWSVFDVRLTEKRSSGDASCFVFFYFFLFLFLFFMTDSNIKPISSDACII
jgi:hypothetical protein